METPSETIKDASPVRKWITHHTSILQVFTAYSSVEHFDRIKIQGKSGFSWRHEKTYPPFLTQNFRVEYSNSVRDVVKSELIDLLELAPTDVDDFPVSNNPAALLCSSDQVSTNHRPTDPQPSIIIVMLISQNTVLI
jgi:hypothetical protein